MTEYPLNITGKEFCLRLGLPYNRGILLSLRDLELISFFKVGKKYYYSSQDVIKVDKMLHSGKISIKTNDGYYITEN